MIPKPTGLRRNRLAGTATGVPPVELRSVASLENTVASSIARGAFHSPTAFSLQSRENDQAIGQCRKPALVRQYSSTRYSRRRTGGKANRSCIFAQCRRRAAMDADEIRRLALGTPYVPAFHARFSTRSVLCGLHRRP